MRRRAPTAPSKSGEVEATNILRTYELSSAKPVRPSPLTTTLNGVPLELLDLLRSFPLFLSAPDAFLAAVTTHIQLRSYNPRDYIIMEGDEAKSMFWLVRGTVAVTSRDGESTYAELRTGAFFGEIGILMNIPRTASIIARAKCVVAHLTKEALTAELPKFPEVERAIRDEAEERLALLRKKKREKQETPVGSVSAGVKRRSEDLDYLQDADHAGQPGTKRQMTPGSGNQWVSNSALGSGIINVRQLLKELPLFATLPSSILHSLGLSALPRTYGPFVRIIEQDSTGGDIYFIVRGEVEVVDESDNVNFPGGRVKARLGKGKFFGEVTALSLAPRRTATVRSVQQVECLVIGGDALAELWKQCPSEIQEQVEKTARLRMDDESEDKVMSNAPTPEDLDEMMVDPLSKFPPPPSLVLTSTAPNETNAVEPFDPDPFFRTDIDNVRARSRRSSIAPPVPSSPSDDHNRSQAPSPMKKHHVTTPPEQPIAVKRVRTLKSRISSRFGMGDFEDKLLIRIFQYLPLPVLMSLRSVSAHWNQILSQSPALFQSLDLRPYNRILTDDALINSITPFIGHRPTYIDISNCFHISDAGFIALAQNCGANVRKWRMRSVWDITGPAILEMSNRSRGLQSIDLSNCRKVSDHLLARVVGWVVPDYPPTNPLFAHGQNPSRYNPSQMQQAPPGTVIGCPQLTSITLSYCKHVTDRTMAHLAHHASNRLTHLDLTRCTTITDLGFQAWSPHRFQNLRSLVLSDCTYLTDASIVYLTNAARNLHLLDLSFCCALSDTATEVLSLGCPHLRVLRLSFCGSAVSDGSLRSVGLHLIDLVELSVRGCVRVTEVGVRAVLEGCRDLKVFDVSQCRHLSGWIENGGVERENGEGGLGRGVRFVTVQGR